MSLQHQNIVLSAFHKSLLTSYYKTEKLTAMTDRDFKMELDAYNKRTRDDTCNSRCMKV